MKGSIMPALKQSAVISISEANNQNSLLALEDEWNRLVKATNNEPFYRYEYIHTWLNNFTPAAKLRVLIGRTSTGELVSLLPLIAEHNSFYGLPVRQLISTANSHSCRFDLIAKDGEAAGQAFFAYLLNDPHWDLLKIIDVPQGGNAWYIYRAAQAAGFPVGNWMSQRSPYLQLPSYYQELMGEYSSQFKATIRRRRKRLEKMGKVYMECVTGGTQLINRLQESFEIEQSGWKGKQGTAIAQDQSTYNFYTELAHKTAEQGFFSLFFLKLNDKSIAFQYTLTYGDTCYLQKLGYDEQFNECSPGLLLMDEVIKDCISRGLRRVDLLGDDTYWKMKWTNQVLPHNWLFIFRRNTVGRVMQNTKFKLVPAMKKILGYWKGNNKSWR
ncbi:MAG: GNAT family N-acetyltransferase [Acidobacteriota bacterium]